MVIQPIGGNLVVAALFASVDVGGDSFADVDVSVLSFWDCLALFLSAAESTNLNSTVSTVGVIFTLLDDW